MVATKKLFTSIALASVGFLVVACSNDAADTSTSATTSAESATSAAREGGEDKANFSVVASTAVWADVASAVFPDVDVTALVSDAAQDPHSFEPSAQDIAVAEQATLLIANGGGYDAWLTDAVSDTEKVISPLPLIAGHDHSHDHEGHDHAAHDHGEGEHDHAAHDHGEGEHDHAAHDHSEETHDHSHDHEGHDHGDGNYVDTVDGNEHVWYDTDAVSLVAKKLAEAAADTDVKADSEAIISEMDALAKRIAALPALKVAQTETIGDYIIEDSSMEDITPESYRATQLGHGEPAAADLAAFLTLLESGEVDVLLFNPQTQTDLQKQIRTAAEKANVTVIEIGENPPAGETFLEHFQDVVSQLEAVKA